MSLSQNISIIIPIYNEALVLESQTEILLKQLNKRKTYNWEIILVENGSSDSTPGIADALASKYESVRSIHLPRASFGAAVKSGILEARHSIGVLMNIDWIEVDFIDRALRMLPKYTIVVGSKVKRNGDQRPVIRRLGSRALTWSLRRFLNFHGSDSHGLKAFQLKPIQKIIPLCRSNELIESELLIRAIEANYSLVEIPVAVKEIRPPRISFYVRCWRMGRELIGLIRLKSATPALMSLHADDTGLNQTVNRTIAQGLLNGSIKSVSVLANGQKVHEVAHILKPYKIDIFLHANFVEGYSLLSPEIVPSIVQSDGSFYSRFSFLIHILLGRVRQEEVVLSLRAQLRELRQLGIEPTGIDSHQHIHALAPIAQACEIVAEEENLSLVRNYSQLKTQTVGGKIIAIVWRCLAYMSQIVNFHQFSLPPTWQRKKMWQPFSIASWESLDLTKQPHIVTVCHPGTNYDRPFVQKNASLLLKEDRTTLE